MSDNNITQERIIQFIYSQSFPRIDVRESGLKSIFYDNNNYPIYVKDTYIQTSCIDLVSELVYKKLKKLCEESVYPAAVDLLVSKGGYYDPDDIMQALNITINHANNIYGYLPNNNKEEVIGGSGR